MTRSGDTRPPAAATLASLAPDPRQGLAVAGKLSLRGVQVASGQPGTRPRDLDRSGRRDLLAAARRHELEICGVDGWLPPEAMLDPSTADRAVSEMLAVIELAGDLGGVPVSIRLPADGADEIVNALAAAASRLGVMLLDHAVPPRGRGALPTEGQAPPSGIIMPGAVEPGIEAMRIGGDSASIEGVGIGIDPPAWLVAGLDVLEGAAAGVGGVRLADLTADGMRIPAGDPDGRIDPAALLAVARTGGFEGLPVIDARRWNDPLGGIRFTMSRLA